jgi:hypothetical protein
VRWGYGGVAGAGSPSFTRAISSRVDPNTEDVVWLFMVKALTALLVLTIALAWMVVAGAGSQAGAGGNPCKRRPQPQVCRYQERKPHVPLPRPKWEPTNRRWT